MKTTLRALESLRKVTHNKQQKIEEEEPTINELFRIEEIQLPFEGLLQYCYFILADSTYVRTYVRLMTILNSFTHMSSLRVQFHFFFCVSV